MCEDLRLTQLTTLQIAEARITALIKRFPNPASNVRPSDYKVIIHGVRQDEDGACEWALALVKQAIQELSTEGAIKHTTIVLLATRMPITTMLNSAWQRKLAKSQLKQMRVANQ